MFTEININTCLCNAYYAKDKEEDTIIKFIKDLAKDTIINVYKVI